MFLELTPQTLISSPVDATEGNVSPQCEFEATPQGTQTLLADEGADAVQDAPKRRSVSGGMVRLQAGSEELEG